MGGKTSTASKSKYNAKAYDNIGVIVPKGQKAVIQAIASRYGLSLNGYINHLIEEAISNKEQEQR